MIKSKNITIKDFNYRSDYSQVLFLQSENLLKQCVHLNFDELKEYRQTNTAIQF